MTVLVNNAAKDERHITEKVTKEFWEWSHSIDLKPHFVAWQAVIAGMPAEGGAIIKFSSISYMMANVGYPVYITAEPRINGITRGMAREFEPDNIRVNPPASGWVVIKNDKSCGHPMRHWPRIWTVNVLNVISRWMITSMRLCFKPRAPAA